MVDRDPQDSVPAADRAVIRIERVALPAGLRAVAHREANGDLVVYVSDQLDPGRQRAAVMEAVRASQRAGWRGAVPAGLAAFGSLRVLRVLRHGSARQALARAARLAHHAGAAARLQPAVWGGAAAVTAGGLASALILITSAPGPHSPASSLGLQPGASVTASAAPGAPAAPGSSGTPRTPRPGRGATRPAAAPTESPPGGHTGKPAPSPPGGVGSSTSPGQTPPASSPATSPVPAPTTTAPPSPAPQPSPSSSPSESPPEPCVDLIVIGVCVPLHL
jgi:hypothetical protein